MDAGELFKLAWPYAVVALPGLWAVYKQWTGGKSLVTIAQDAAKSVIVELRAEVERLQEQVDDLVAELSLARKEHADTLAAKDAELALARGENRQLRAQLEALERLLDDAGIPHERVMQQPFYRVPPGIGPADLEPL